MLCVHGITNSGMSTLSMICMIPLSALTAGPQHLSPIDRDARSHPWRNRIAGEKAYLPFRGMLPRELGAREERHARLILPGMRLCQNQVVGQVIPGGFLVLEGSASSLP
jgi:hypothetical protein